MSGQSTPVNASDVVTLDMKNLSGSVQFRVTVDGDLQWKLLNGSTWFKICNIELLRGRSITDVTVNAQNKFVLTFSDLTTQVITISALEDAVLRATNAATQALASAGAASAVAMGQATARANTRPSVFFDFSNSKFLPNYVTSNRNSLASYIDKNGYLKFAPSNTPRFTHDPITLESQGYLHESGKTNKIKTWDLTSSLFLKNSTPISIENNIKSPSGNFGDCYRITDASNANEAYLYTIANLEDTTVHTFSVFLKAETIGGGCALQVHKDASGVRAGFNLITGVASAPALTGAASTFQAISSRIKAYKNGWYRCELTFSYASDLSVMCDIIPVRSTHTASVGTDYMYAYGPQLERGGYASTPIQTSGVEYTRLSDAFSVTGNNFPKIFPVIENGTFVIESEKSLINTFSTFFELRGADTAGGWNVIRCYNEGNNIKADIVVNGVMTATTSTTFVQNTDAKFRFAFSFGKNYFRAACAGVIGALDVDVELPQNINTFQIISTNATIRSIAYWPRLFSDVELTEMSKTDILSGRRANQLPANQDLGSAAFMDIPSMLSSKNRQEFSIDCTGSSITRNIRRPYAFTFEIVDSSGVTVTSQPASSCVENTDNNLVINGAVGKTLTYAITPIFEY